MRRRLLSSLTALAVLSGGCAPNVAAYTPALDPALSTGLTSRHLEYCRGLVAALPQPSLWGSVAGQAGTSSGESWVTALELGTSQALGAAAAATAAGTVLGAHSGITARQEAAESSVRLCMQNYHEAILEKP